MATQKNSKSLFSFAQTSEIKLVACQVKYMTLLCHIANNTLSILRDEDFVKKPTRTTFDLFDFNWISTFASILEKGVRIF